MTDNPLTSTPSAARVAAPPNGGSSLVGELTDSIAPMPTRTTVWMRTFVPYQAYRFAMVSVKMLKMIRRSHTH
jgi:hypothetical protein